jgi:hypothetical protein
MAAHGGRVDVVSAPDQGSIFTLEFPISVVLAGAGSHSTLGRDRLKSAETARVS